MDLICQICESRGVAHSRAGAAQIRVQCPICTIYDLTSTAAVILPHESREKRFLLAGKVRRHWRKTKRAMLVSSELLAAVHGPQLVSVPEKQDALLLDIAAQSAFPGSIVKLNPFDCVVVDATPGDELAYHVQSLIARDFLQQHSSIYEAVLTPRGWEHVERLQHPAAGNSSDIFVAMSFAESLRSAWEDGIKPGVLAAGYRPKRVDSDAHNDKIDDRIIAGIRGSFATVVDVTTQNPGAYFEAGFALGLGRPVVWTVNSDDLPKLHFDTRQFNHLVWSNPVELREKLKIHLLAVFGKGPASPTDAD